MHDKIHKLTGLITLAFLPWKVRLICYSGIGVILGLGLAIAKVSRVTSYMSNEPEACVNCHVMRSEYASWKHSSHANVATCNDCHVPHETKVGALAFKARDGLYHSYIFTFRLEPQVIELSEGAKPVVQSNCVRCHEETVGFVDSFPVCPVPVCPEPNHEDRWCWECHEAVPHGMVRGQSTAPSVMAPRLPPVIHRQIPEVGGRRPVPDRNSEPKSHKE